MNRQTLYKRDKSGKKILCFEIQKEELSPDNDFTEQGKLALYTSYAVTRKTGQLGGKMIDHAPDIIQMGKGGRSTEQQAELVFNSHVNSKRDEGYKAFEDTDPNSEAVNQFGSLEKYLLWVLPTDRTDANGTLKPMKCTALNDPKTNEIMPKVAKKIVYPAYGQPKLDGVRCFMRKENGSWHATSSSGKSYDCVARYIVHELEGFADLPDGTILDGELYIHGVSLQKISGWCRKATPIFEHQQIQFHVFDVACKEKQNVRLGKLNDLISASLDHVVLVPVYVINEESEIQPLHDRLVEDGYEGLIIRNADGMYEFGIRSSKIFKYKNFQDDEFVITGAIPGKRGAADMVFTVKTATGKSFEAKPHGTFEDKEKWMGDINNIIGKFGTVRFLTYSDDAIPQGNTVLKVIRDYE